MTHVMTKQEFEALPPKERGYAAYMAGCRDDQPNIPDERNPYPAGSKEAEQWEQGQYMGVLEAQDCDD